MKSAYLDKDGVKKGAWSEEEDAKLREYILRYGHWNWRLLPKFAGLERCGKSCRLRWMNYLKPSVRRGNYTKEERDLIDKLHHQLGNKWSAIAAKLPGRSDNDIKNYWHTQFRKREKARSGQNSSISRESETQSSRIERRENPASVFSGGVAPRSRRRELGNCSGSSDVFILESSISNLASSETSAAVESDLDSPADKIFASSVTSGESDELFLSGLDGSFWNQPFIVDTYSHGDSFSLLDEALPFMY